MILEPGAVTAAAQQLFNSCAAPGGKGLGSFQMMATHEIGKT
jgi:hypothetical protein